MGTPDTPRARGAKLIQAAQPPTGVPHLLYRIAADIPPTEVTFAFHVALGRAPRRNVDQREWEGVSLWDSREQAVAMAKHFRLGEWIVVHVEEA